MRHRDARPRRRFSAGALLLGALISGVAVVGGAVGGARADYQPTDTGATLSAEVGGVYEFSELAVPAAVEMPAAGLSVVDTLSGRALAPRASQQTASGTRLEIPQLPVGTFLVTSPEGDATIRVLPETGSPVELDGEHGGSVLPLVAAFGLLFVIGVAGVASSGRRRVYLLLLAPGALLPLLLRDDGPPVVESWESCAAYATPDPRESELLRRNCKVRFMLDMLESDGSGAARVESYMKTVTDSSCHEVAHLTGFYFSRTTPDAATAIRALLPGCDDGMAHGVLEALSLFHDDQDFPTLTSDLCGGLPAGKMQKTCAHGLGHAMLWRTNGDLGGAWELCTKTEDRREGGYREAFARKVLPLTDTEFSSVDECYSAAVMEWADRWEFERRAGGAHTLRPEIDEPMDVCREEGLTELFYVGCYLGTNYRNRDAAAAAVRCNEIAPYPVSCFATIGDNLVLFNEANLGTELTVELATSHAGACASADDAAAADACAAALSYRFLLNVKDMTRGEAVCAAVPEALRPGCGRGLSLAGDTLLGRGLDVDAG